MSFVHFSTFPFTDKIQSEHFVCIDIWNGRKFDGAQIWSAETKHYTSAQIQSKASIINSQLSNRSIWLNLHWIKSILRINPKIPIQVHNIWNLGIGLFLSSQNSGWKNFLFWKAVSQVSALITQWHNFKTNYLETEQHSSK